MILGNIINKIIGRDQYTIGELMKIDEKRKNKAAQCKVNLVKTFHVLQKESVLDKFKQFFTGKPAILTAYVVFKLRVISDTGSVHYVFIKADPDFTLSGYNQNKVQIYCDCADFKYRSAPTLKSRNSLFTTTKLTIPDESGSKTGRHVVPSLLCKHALAALLWLKQNYSTVMKTV